MYLLLYLCTHSFQMIYYSNLDVHRSTKYAPQSTLLKVDSILWSNKNNKVLNCKLMIDINYYDQNSNSTRLTCSLVFKYYKVLLTTLECSPRAFRMLWNLSYNEKLLTLGNWFYFYFNFKSSLQVISGQMLQITWVVNKGNTIFNI